MKTVANARNLAGGLAALVLTVTVVSIAYASIPDPDGVIHGCYRPHPDRLHQPTPNAF